MPNRMRSTYAQEVLERIRTAPHREPRTLWDRFPHPRRAFFPLGAALAAALAILVVLPITPGGKSRPNGSTISSEKEDAVSALVDELDTLEAVSENEAMTPEDLSEELIDFDRLELGQT